jgi:hypothetical protein
VRPTFLGLVARPAQPGAVLSWQDPIDLSKKNQQNQRLARLLALDNRRSPSPGTPGHRVRPPAPAWHSCLEPGSVTRGPAIRLPAAHSARLWYRLFHLARPQTVSLVERPASARSWLSVLRCGRPEKHRQNCFGLRNP